MGRVREGSRASQRPHPASSPPGRSAWTASFPCGPEKTREERGRRPPADRGRRPVESKACCWSPGEWECQRRCGETCRAHAEPTPAWSTSTRMRAEDRFPFPNAASCRPTLPRALAAVQQLLTPLSFPGPLHPNSDASCTSRVRTSDRQEALRRQIGSLLL